MKRQTCRAHNMKLMIICIICERDSSFLQSNQELRTIRGRPPTHNYGCGESSPVLLSGNTVFASRVMKKSMFPCDVWISPLVCALTSHDNGNPGIFATIGKPSTWLPLEKSQSKLASPSAVWHSCKAGMGAKHSPWPRRRTSADS